MDNAVALVEAYLYVNGYFTVTEYPVIEAAKQGGYQMTTDLDVLAFRFPGAGRLVPGKHGDVLLAPDPALNSPEGSADMIIAEVKEGRAELNRGARDPGVLQVVLTRFGCCPAAGSRETVQHLLNKGRATTSAGHRVRLMAFGAVTNQATPHRHEVMSLGHVICFLQEYLREHWSILHHAQFKHPAFGFLMMLEKASREQRVSGRE